MALSGTLLLAAVLVVGVRAQEAPAIPLPKAAAKILALQVALDRAGFSPGEIDARRGTFTSRALQAFREARGLGAANPDNPAFARALGDVYTKPVTSYVITEADAAGPFVEAIPKDMIKQAELEALGYTSLSEALAERFHLSPALLSRLNPRVRLEAGATIVVPAVEPLEIPTHQGKRPRVPSAAASGRTMELAKETGAVIVRDAGGAILMYAPVTVGSQQDPLPVGDWKITGIYDRPIFNYNPDLFWDAQEGHGKARIAAGPNNPVGLVWIDINKPHFGFHGTPEPSRIGRTESHGCVRMTNWDALRLAALIEDGTPVKLR
jgi:lipoprotein-anchoring transpeptidase ErfK/SrfK